MHSSTTLPNPQADSSREIAELRELIRELGAAETPTQISVLKPQIQERMVALVQERLSEPALGSAEMVDA